MLSFQLQKQRITAIKVSIRIFKENKCNKVLRINGLKVEYKCSSWSKHYCETENRKQREPVGNK